MNGRAYLGELKSETLGKQKAYRMGGSWLSLGGAGWEILQEPYFLAILGNVIPQQL